MDTIYTLLGWGQVKQDPEPIPAVPPLLPAEFWLHDAQRLDCQQCYQPFTLFTRRRHHCRFCGDLFCYECCPVTTFDQGFRVRCCSYCKTHAHSHTEPNLDYIRNQHRRNGDMRNGLQSSSALLVTGRSPQWSDSEPDWDSSTALSSPPSSSQSPNAEHLVNPEPFFLHYEPMQALIRPQPPLVPTSHELMVGSAH